MSPAFLNADGSVDSSKVSVMRDGTKISGVTVTYDSAARILTISGMGEDKTNWEKPITIAYPTKINTDLSLPTPGSNAAVSQGGKLTNQAVLWGKESAGGELKSMGIKGTATYTLDKTTYLSKKVEKVGADGRLLRWTVTVDRGAIPTGKTITLPDTLPGAEFALYDNELCGGVPLATKSTDASGQAVFENLEPDRPLWLKEIKPPAGYQANGTVIKIQIDSSGILEVTKTVNNTALPSAGCSGCSDAAFGNCDRKAVQR